MKNDVISLASAGAAPGIRTGSPVPPAATSAGPAGRLLAYLELTKPGITRLTVVTTAAGFYLAASGIDLWLLAHTLVGTYLAASGTNALNQWWERDIDARMRRTRGRPIPSGRMKPSEALWFSSVLAAVGLFHLMVFVNLATALVVAASLFSYVFVYTPLKRRTSLSTLVGAIPGALPIVAGWTAAGGRFDAVAGTLFCILFLWQLPHFLALAWIYREDYRDGGLAMLSVVDPSGQQTGRQAMLYGLALVPVSLLPTLLGLTGAVYFFGALVLGIAFLATAAGMMLWRTEKWAWRLFYASVVYLPLVLLLMVADKLPG